MRGQHQNNKNKTSATHVSDKYKNKSQTEERIAIFAINRRKSLNKIYKRGGKNKL